jgi:phage tail-like protein
MSNKDKNNYVFLNRLGRWPGFHWAGLELDCGGTLRLSPLPLLSGVVPEEVRNSPVPNGPAGLAIDSLGAIYFSDPDNNRISRIDNCDGSVGPIPCLGGTGRQASQILTPRGLLIPHGRNVLFVVDSGNHRIQVFDLRTFHLIEIWGQAALGGSPQPGTNPGQLNTPWALAGDSDGNVYVVDYGNQRVQKFNALGDVQSSFWENILAHSSLRNPTDIVVREYNGTVWIFVLEPSKATIHVFHADGTPLVDEHNDAWTIVSSSAPGGNSAPPGDPQYIPDLYDAMGMAAYGNSLYVGDDDPDHRRILTFHIGEEIEVAGEAIGYDGPVAALLLKGKDDLLVHAGGAPQPLLLKARAGCRTDGALWNYIPIQVPSRKVVWHRLQSLIKPLPENAELDLFVYTTSKDGDRPPIRYGAANPFSDPKWKPLPYAADTSNDDVYIGGKEATYLWIGALFVSDGTASAELSQLRVEFDHATYDQYLPAIFRDKKGCEEFLPRLLSLFESFNMDVEGEIAAIPALFDPRATPGKFLAWLAGCLGLDLDKNWEERKQRRIIAEIFRLSGRRGTTAGLRESLRIFAGVDAVIEEPILHASWWALPGAPESCCEGCAAHAGGNESLQGGEKSILGWTTMLAPAQPQGAVVGTSCDVDQSHLITNDDFGSPLFTDVAYQFSVGVYRGQIMCEGVLPQIQAVLEQEKPAHTNYQLCVIEPHFRVGFQSRIGIDTVVAGTSRSMALGSGQLLGTETVLAGNAVSRLGMETRLGVTTRLD